MARFVRRAGSFAVITGTLGTEDHAEKVDGFRSSVREIGNKHEMAGVVEAHDDEHLAYNATKDLLTRADLAESTSVPRTHSRCSRRSRNRDAPAQSP